MKSMDGGVPNGKFVAGYAKTDFPTYIEKHRKQQARTGDGFRMPIKDFHPAVRHQKVKMERRRKL